MSKNQRREAAREAARLAREKQQRRQRLLKWVVPSSVSLAIVAIVAIVALVIVLNPPPVQSQVGPRNMISGGIGFSADESGEVAPELTASLAEDADPVPTVREDDGKAHIVAYVDFSCPACKSFEEAYGPSLLSLVASGVATIEYHQVAILDSRYAGSRYSTRSNNVGACVAEYAPESYLPVMTQMFALQPSEGTRGHDNNELVDIVHSAGLENADVDRCIRDEYFAPFVTRMTDLVTADQSLKGAEGRFSTPTYVVNGTLWDRSDDLLEFVQSFVTTVPAG